MSTSRRGFLAAIAALLGFRKLAAAHGPIAVTQPAKPPYPFCGGDIVIITGLPGLWRVCHTTIGPGFDVVRVDGPGNAYVKPRDILRNLGNSFEKPITP